ncbi:DNA-directed RNA polymerase specialized sigma24 family protein [Silvibacterium bohemicum]|uniref:DNA-directed RNA polymerase specialized sigma24 family protein n=1 Tax=Silvibacterium bohemicum TaxID=1577686 RepID=A0A841K0J8_9BACT|nr:sigma-70 family RNA polymerase sigma factor [Silvibacterium bohemicum]MBB6144731.1 DNA-directed RNA polymerase specialized sigma24 family protein [Silvibacterium bohemicum]
MIKDLDKLYARYVTDPNVLGELLQAVSSYGAYVSRYAGHSDPEDAGQETMLRFWHKLGEYDPSRGSLKPWIKSIATNLVRNDMASLERRSTDMPGELPEPTTVSFDAIHVDLRKYTMKERAVLYWTAIDKDFSLTAQRFDCTPQELRRLLHRIKVKYNPAA